MKKTVVSRKRAACAAVQSPLRIYDYALPGREMLYVIGVFNGQYLMAEISSHVSRSLTIEWSARPRRVVKGENVRPTVAFYRGKFAEVFQFRYVRTCIATCVLVASSFRLRDPRRKYNAIVVSSERKGCANIAETARGESIERKSEIVENERERGKEECVRREKKVDTPPERRLFPSAIARSGTSGFKPLSKSYCDSFATILRYIRCHFRRLTRFPCPSPRVVYPSIRVS